MQSSVPPELRGFFTSGVGWITVQSKEGPNIMSAEWTFNISYRPFLIAALIDSSEATHDIMRKLKSLALTYGIRSRLRYQAPRETIPCKT